MATYKIKSGDTLSAIAKANGTTVAALQSANGIKDANKIYAGATITIPSAAKPTPAPVKVSTPAPKATVSTPPPAPKPTSTPVVSSSSKSSSSSSSSSKSKSSSSSSSSSKTSTPAPKVSTPAPAPAQSSSSSSIKIKSGDTLSALAKTYGTTVAALQAANNISDPNKIQAGTNLIIPKTSTPQPAPAPVPGPVKAPVVTPAPTVTPTQTPAPKATETQITIKSGDTLSAIAKANGVTVDALAKANGIADPNKIQAGKTLIIPSATSTPTQTPTVTPTPTSTPTPTPSPTEAPQASQTSYLIKSGDTLSAIALANGTTVAALAAANGITDPNKIQAGKTLIIPGKGSTPLATPESSTLPSKLPALPTLTPEQQKQQEIEALNEQGNASQDEALAILLKELGGSVEVSSSEKMIAALTKTFDEKNAPSETLPSLAEQLAQKRKEVGVDPLENEIGSIDAEIAKLDSEFETLQDTETNRQVSVMQINRRKSDQQIKYEAARADLINKKNAIANELSNKYSVINTYMQYAGQDYNNAQQEYTTKFNQSVAMINLVKGIEDDAKDDLERRQDNAKANLSLMINALDGKQFSSLDSASIANLDKLALQSGIPSGVIRSILGAKDTVSSADKKESEVASQLSIAQQFVADNPDASSNELELELKKRLPKLTDSDIKSVISTKKITKAQITSTVTQKAAYDGLKATYTTKELKALADKAGSSSFWTGAEKDIERWLNSPDAKSVYEELLYQQYKTAGMAA